MIRWFDTHAHLDDARYDEDRDAVIREMFEGGIARVALIGSDMPSSRRAVALAGTDDRFIASAAVHPHAAKTFTQDDLAELLLFMQNPKVRAFGEIGLDFFYDHSPREVQVEVFVAQLEVAMRIAKPVILHVRDAHNEVLEILKARRGRLPRFVVHCFSGSAEIMREYLKMDAFISLAGPVTYKNANKLLDVAREAPMERLMIETDSPYLAPTPMRGKRNSPLYVQYVGETVARLRGMDVEALAEATYGNGLAFYGISDMKAEGLA